MPERNRRRKEFRVRVFTPASGIEGDRKMVLSGQLIYSDSARSLVRRKAYGHFSQSSVRNGDAGNPSRL